jgi:hypothetical protein
MNTTKKPAFRLAGATGRKTSPSETDKPSPRGVMLQVTLGKRPVSKEVIKARFGLTQTSFPEIVKRRVKEDLLRAEKSHLVQSSELQYWSTELGVSCDELVKAISKVGASVPALKAYTKLIKR